MTYKLGKKEAGAISLYNLLSQHDGLAVAEIMELLGINRKSVYNYFDYLEEQGIRLSSSNKGHKKVYSLAQDNEDLGKYQPIDKNVLRTFSIVRTLQSKPMPIKELLALYDKADLIVNDSVKRGDIDFGFKEGTHSIDIQRTQLDKLLRSIVNEGILEQPEKNGILYPTGNHVPVVLELDREEASDYYYDLKRISEGHPHYAALKSIHNKLGYMTGDFTEIDNNFFVNYGSRNIGLKNIEAAIAKLSGKDCTRYIIKCTYVGKNKNLNVVYLAAGLLVYSAEKDTVYLMGKKANAAGKIKAGHHILNMNFVTAIEATEYTNEFWHSDEYMSIFAEMFSIADEKPEKVIVEFDNIRSVRRKIGRLLWQRPKASLSVNNEQTFIYTDVIRGMSDFASYLRRYGKSCRVIEPASLRKIMDETVKHSIARYEEAGYGEIL